MNQPNILLISMDQLRHDFLGINGHEQCQTPQIDQLALSGINYQQAISECPVCIPARRILMTGLNTYSIGMTGNDTSKLFTEGPKLAELLTQAGYHSHAVGKLHTNPVRDRLGFNDVELNEEGREGGLAYPDDYMQFIQDAGYGPVLNSHGMGNNQYGCRESPVPEPFTSTGWTADRAMRFLRRRDPNKPFFLYVSFDKPHPPLTPPREYLDLYRNVTFPDPVNGPWIEQKRMKKHDLSKYDHNWEAYTGRHNIVQESLRGFAASITHIDSRIGQLMGTLREMRVMKNTWVMIVADHGDMCFDHQLTDKGAFVGGSPRIPFILTPPSSASEFRSSSRQDHSTPVGLQDVMPTLLDIAGVPVPESVDGVSLLPNLRDPKSSLRDCIFGNTQGQYSANDGSYLYIWDQERKFELLFDMKLDPKSVKDLSDQEKYFEVKQKLSSKLKAWMNKNGDENSRNVGVSEGLVDNPRSSPNYRNNPWNNRGFRP